MVGVIKTILILVLIYYGLKILTRLFAPLLVRYVAKKAEQKINEQFGRQHQTNTSAREGETTIDHQPKHRKTSSNKVGEYIDFEEVD